MSSPTARSMKHLRDLGYLVDVVERWVPGAFIRRDLFGMFDLIAVRGSETLVVQTTSDDNLASRVTKVKEHENIERVREAGWRCEAHGWKKVKNRWRVRIVDCS